MVTGLGTKQFKILIPLICSSTLLAAPSSSPTVQEIVDRAILRSESQLKSNLEAHFEVLLQVVKQSLDAEGAVTDTETFLYSRYPVHGAMHDELIAKDGRDLTAKEEQEEQEKKDDFITEVKERIAEGKPPQPEDERQVRFDREFMSRYQTSLIGEEMVRGHSCWVVHFEPKPGKFPVRRRLDEALNKSTGEIWISKDDFGLVRAQFEMREPVRYLGGLLATVRNTIGHLEFERVEPDIWFPVDFKLQLDMRILFKNIRRNIVMNWCNYERTERSRIPQLSTHEGVTQ